MHTVLVITFTLRITCKMIREWLTHGVWCAVWWWGGVWGMGCVVCSVVCSVVVVWGVRCGVWGVTVKHVLYAEL